MSVRRTGGGWAAVLLAAFATMAAADDREPLRLEPGRQLAAVTSRAAVAEFTLRPDVERLTTGPAAVVVDLAGAARLEIERTAFARRGAGAFLWEGRVSGGGDAVLTGSGGFVAGVIYGPRSVWEIVPAAGDGHRLVQVDPDRLPGCGGVPEIGGPKELVAEPAVAEGSMRIDVLVLYEPAVREAYGSARAIETQIQHLIDLTNVAYKNSEVSARVRLVHAEERAIPADANTNRSHLLWLRDNAGVRALRDEHGADVVGLLYERETDACGTAAMVFRPGDGSSRAVFDVDRRCGAASMTFSHEIGHLQGGDHNPEDAVTEPTDEFPDSYGHYHDGQYRTIMSYSSQCSGPCPAMPFFSNPGIRHDGKLTGLRNRRDNARVFEETAALVAGFRPPAAGSDCSLPAGHKDFCLECGPCGAGEGDCDKDADCGADLVCLESGRTDVCGVPGPCPVKPGHRDYCRLCGPCPFGVGDCDLDRECQVGMTCVDDVGEVFGEEPYIDVCSHDPSDFCPLPAGHPDYCEACGPCGVGQGNCKRSAECGFFECLEGAGANWGYSPETNVCFYRSSDDECQLAPGHFNYCNACGLCDVGEGDCDGDEECRPGLTCADGAGAEFGLDPDTDVCVAAAALAAPKRLRATALSPTEVRLRWRDRSDGEDSFQVQKKRAAKRRFRKTATVGANVKRVVISGLKPGTAYTFRVRARSGSVFSDFSNEVAVTTPR